jgi:uracil-DNA glycosylase
MDKNLDWSDILAEEKTKKYFPEIIHHINRQKKQGKVIYPKERDIFNAFRLCLLSSLKVVILGQDPYHGINQSHGLAFSVPESTAIPPSLLNIYKELEGDLAIKIASHGCLNSWAKQGVLLLNSTLTVEAHKPNSHSTIGWENFTDTVISQISKVKNHVVFLLWGAHAQKKEKLINENQHLILKAPHPSPFSVHRGFFGCKHFSQSNNYLLSKGLPMVNWQIE